MNDNFTKHHQLHDFLTRTASKGRFTAVLGRPISQSLSPLIHNAAFEHYQLDLACYPIYVSEAEEPLIPDLLHHPNFVGVNVTIPFKQKVVHLLDDVSELVTQTNACNTIYRNSEGQLSGENTDVYGFKSPLRVFKSEIKLKDAIIFGSGGVCKAAIKALQDMNAGAIYVVSRNPGISTQVGVQWLNYQDWSAMASDAAILINASPIGMYPNVNESPVLSDQVSSLRGKICYDLVYRPIWTRFLEQAASVGASCIDGVPMFIGQAAKAFKLFTGLEFPSEIADQMVRQKLKADIKE
jgi:shikimate dehydrogenase